MCLRAHGTFEADSRCRGHGQIQIFSLQRDAVHGPSLIWSGFFLPAGTGPETAVTGQTGPDRFRYRPVSNRSKFKIQIWIQKNKKIPKNTSSCDESNGYKIFQIFVHLVYFASIWS